MVTCSRPWLGQRNWTSAVVVVVFVARIVSRTIALEVVRFGSAQCLESSETLRPAQTWLADEAHTYLTTFEVGTAAGLGRQRENFARSQSLVWELDGMQSETQCQSQEADHRDHRPGIHRPRPLWLAMDRLHHPLAVSEHRKVLPTWLHQRDQWFSVLCPLWPNSRWMAD
jgi:hypothetical protein